MLLLCLVELLIYLQLTKHGVGEMDMGTVQPDKKDSKNETLLVSPARVCFSRPVPANPETAYPPATVDDVRAITIRETFQVPSERGLI